MAVTIDGTNGINNGDADITNVGDIAVDSISGDADSNTKITFEGSDVISFDTSGSEAMRIDSSQRVLMGHTSSLGNNRQFQVINGAGNAVQSIITAVNGNGGAQLEFVKGRGGVAQNNATIVQNNDAIGLIRFFAADGTDLNSEAARISAEVGGTPGSNDMPGRLRFMTTADGASSPTERMRIDSSGDLAVGTTTSTARLCVSDSRTDQYAFKLNCSRAGGGTGYLVQFTENTPNFSNDLGSIRSNGSSISYNTTSDYRLKENVVDMTGAIDRVKTLNPSQFNFTAAPDMTVDGFLAHEVQAVVPEAVVGEKDAVDADGNPDYQGIDQSKLVPLLTGALQEAIAKIETLETTVTNLQTRVTALEAN
jgi:hypothetical protein